MSIGHFDFVPGTLLSDMTRGIPGLLRLLGALIIYLDVMLLEWSCRALISPKLSHESPPRLAAHEALALSG